MEESDRELLSGMGNCYAACGEDFDGTVGMVAHARGLTASEVALRLRAMATRYAGDPEYGRLRARVPEGFPF